MSEGTTFLNPEVLETKDIVIKVFNEDLTQKEFAMELTDELIGRVPAVGENILNPDDKKKVWEVIKVYHLPHFDDIEIRAAIVVKERELDDGEQEIVDFSWH